MGLGSGGLSGGGLSSGGLRAVSFSRDSAGKEERLQEWRERKGLHDREHRRNRWTAARHGIDIAAELCSCECAAEVGARGEQIIAAAREVDATVVLVPSLRRLGVGVAQTQLRQRIESAGLAIYSERETENAVLRSEPSPTRDLLLAHMAATDEYEWQVNKERLARAHFDYWSTAEGQAALAFIAERPHLSLRQLGAAMTFRGLRGPTGRTDVWHPTSVKRARERARRIRAAPIRGTG